MALIYNNIFYFNNLNKLGGTEQFLYEIAKKEIENAMELARHILGFAPEDYLIKRLNDSFCKTNKNIILVSY